MREIKILFDRCEELVEMVYAGEIRATAVDGPVDHCLDHLDRGEFDRWWRRFERALRLAKEASHDPDRQA